jgi:hypothetical protein
MSAGLRGSGGRRGGSARRAFWRRWARGAAAPAAIAGVLGTAAAVLSRFAIVDAGCHSAADPRATFAPQRAGD